MTGAGSGWLVASTVYTGENAISVTGGLCESDEGMKSCTFPRTRRRLPTTAAAVGWLLLPVKTKIPSAVFRSPSFSESGAWMKKPLLFTAVTMPSVCRSVPAQVEKTSVPCTVWMASFGPGTVTVSAIDAVALRPCASPTRTGMEKVPVALLAGIVAVAEKVPSPLAVNACVEDPPMADRSPLTMMPVLVGF